MVDRNSNIDLVFRNGLKEFEVLPPPDLWGNIRPMVRKKSQAVLYMRAATITGFIVAGGALTWYLSVSLSENLNGPAITLNQDSRPEGTYIPPAGRLNTSPETVSAGELTVPRPVQSGDVTADHAYSFILPKTETFAPVINSLNIYSSGGRLLNSNSAVKSQVIMPYSNKVIRDYDIARVEDVPVYMNRWNLGAFMSPTYYSKFGTGSTDQEKALAASENSAMSYTGGIAFGFKVTRRISLQMGIFYNSLNQEINGVKSYSGFMRFYSMKGTDNFEIATSNGTIISRNNDIFLANDRTGTRVTSIFSSDIFDPNKAGLTYLNSTVYQNFNYLEVPFFVRYKFIDRTLGLNVIGGISYNKLLNNSAYALSGGNRYYIGETDGLYPVMLSSSLGLGMEYNLSKAFSINLEPTFKYFLTPMSGQVGSSMHQYTFGIFSGVSWKF